MKVFQRLFLLCVLVIGCYRYQTWWGLISNIGNVKGRVDPRSHGDDAWLSRNSGEVPEGRKASIMLNSYMRSGSSFTGELLGHRNDTFYFYEPMWSMSIYNYFKGNDSVCSMRRPECRPTVHGSSKGLELLTYIYTCNGSMVHWVTSLAVKNSGGAMERFRKCRENLQPNKTEVHRVCTPMLEQLCRKLPNVVTKVLRLSVDTLEPLLIQHPDLKILHLFRDPRAVINSKKKTIWYPKYSSMDEIEDDVASLCQKMDDDYEQGVVLQKKYPDRFKMILYEDLMSDLPRKTRALFRFSGLEFTAQDQEKIDFLTQKKTETEASVLVDSKKTKSRIYRTDKEKDYAFWWRMNIDWKTVKHSDTHCKDLYPKLGYTLFEDEDALRNMDITGMSNHNITPL